MPLPGSSFHPAGIVQLTPWAWGGLSTIPEGIDMGEDISLGTCRVSMESRRQAENTIIIIKEKIIFTALV